DVAGDVRGGEKDDRKQHQADGDVPHESGRRPNLDPVMRLILPEAPDNQRNTHERNQPEQRAIDGESEPLDHGRARLAERHEDVAGEKDDQPEDEDQQTHTKLPARGAVEAKPRPEARQDRPRAGWSQRSANASTSNAALLHVLDIGENDTWRALACVVEDKLVARHEYPIAVQIIGDG